MANTATSIDLVPPDIACWRAGNTGVEYVWRWTAPEPGPNVAITALMHGNEICGAIALDRLLQAEVRPTRGTLTLAFLNVDAFLTFDPKDPHASRYLDEDMNRVWDRATLEGSRGSRELRRARATRRFFDDADFLLDIHSMTNANAPMMLTGMADRHVTFARRVGVPSYLVRDAGHESGSRLRDYDRFADPDASPIALLIECGQHWARETAEVATETAWRFLAATGILDPADAAHLLAQRAEPQRCVLVTHRVDVTHDDFQFTDDYLGLEIIARAGTVFARERGRAFHTPYDDCVLIMPARRIVRGTTAVRLGRFEWSEGAG